MKTGILDNVTVAIAVAFVTVTKLGFVDKLLRINKAKKDPRK